MAAQFHVPFFLFKFSSLSLFLAYILVTDCETFFNLFQFLRLMHLFHQTGPLVVHCSAGIGRTGVLITIDTALALIEQNEKVRSCLHVKWVHLSSTTANFLWSSSWLSRTWAAQVHTLHPHTFFQKTKISQWSSQYFILSPKQTNIFLFWLFYEIKLYVQVDFKKQHCESPLKLCKLF